MVDGDDEALILDRACVGENLPVLLARGWPVGDDDERVGPGAYFAKELGESEVEADEEGEGDAVDLDEARLVAGGVDLGLLCVAEEALLVVRPGDRTVRGKRQERS